MCLSLSLITFVFSIFVFFFFFQAEDGIRDLTVTGVQTCALPIYEAELAGVMAHEIAHVAARHAMENQRKMELMDYGMLAGILLGGPILSNVLRSEERRVGKECRSGWGPDQ